MNVLEWCYDPEVMNARFDMYTEYSTKVIEDDKPMGVEGWGLERSNYWGCISLLGKEDVLRGYRKFKLRWRCSHIFTFTGPHRLARVHG